LYPEDKVSKVIRNVGMYLRNYTAPQSKRS